MPSITLRDVAKRCRVSTTTVSAVVNGADWVSAHTRTRVQHVIEQMGYRPNKSARSLKTQRGYAVGVIVSDLTNPFFTEVVRSLSHALHEDGHALFLCDSDHRFELGGTHLRMLDDGHVVGLVLIGDSVPEDALARYAARKDHVPIVAIERDYAIDGVSCLLSESEQGAYRATRHLIDQGYRRIAMIGGPSSGPGSATFGRAHRLQGYHRALREAGIAPNPRLVAEGNFRYGGGQEAMRSLLAGNRKFDAVFAANDMMALGAMSVLRDAGLRVPQDVALVGFDDISIAGLTTPGLTTVAMPKGELGRAAATVLRAQLSPANGRAAVVKRVFDTALVVRQSSVRTND